MISLDQGIIPMRGTDPKGDGVTLGQETITYQITWPTLWTFAFRPPPPKKKHAGTSGIYSVFM